jgi:hypothetical protein
VDYSLLTRAAREKASRDDESLVVAGGRVEMRSKAMNLKTKGAMEQIEWIAAAKTVEERTLTYHGLARSAPLKVHRRNVMEVARTYNWDTARVYDAKTRELMASDSRHDPSPINQSLVLQANAAFERKKMAALVQQSHGFRGPASTHTSYASQGAAYSGPFPSTPSATGSSLPQDVSNPYDQSSRQPRQSKQASKCFRCGRHRSRFGDL